jgi:hypothetical protein
MVEGTAWQRWSSVALVAAVLVPVTLFQPYHNGPPIRSDGEAYHLWTRVLLEGDLSFERYKKVQAIDPPLEPLHGRYTNRYPPGLALLRLPVMAFLVQLGPAAPLISPAEHWANLILGALALVAVCVLVLRTCELLNIQVSIRHRAVLAIVFGTGLFHYATYDASFSHVYSALGVALLAWQGIGAVVRGRLWPNRPVTALTCFFLVLIRNTNVILIAMLALAYLGWHISPTRKRGVPSLARRANSLRMWQAFRGLAGVIVGTVAAAALQLAINWYYNGHPALSSYGSETFVWDRPMQWPVLFSYERGLFSYYPVLIVVLAAAWLVRPTRGAAGWFSALVLVYATLYGFWWCWMLGGGFGHRGFVELTPLAAILFAVALEQMSPRLRMLFYQGKLVAAVVTLMFMLEYWRGSLPCMGVTGDRYWRYALRGLGMAAVLVAGSLLRRYAGSSSPATTLRSATNLSISR